MGLPPFKIIPSPRVCVASAPPSARGPPCTPAPVISVVDRAIGGVEGVRIPGGEGGWTGARTTQRHLATFGRLVQWHARRRQASPPPGNVHGALMRRH